MIQKVRINWNPNKKSLLSQNLYKEDKVIALIQARETSTRFPRKIYEDLNGCPLIYHVVDRAEQAKLIDKVIVASPHTLEDLPEGTETFVYEENENDVLERFYWASKFNPSNYIVRLTADCPLLDPDLIDFVVNQALVVSADYCSNVMKLTFPDGNDIEVIKRETLQFLHQSIKDERLREHVTLAIRENLKLQEVLKCVSIENETDLSKVKTSVDTQEDLERVREIEKNR